MIPGTGRKKCSRLGHTSEQGAEDNATGVAATLEALATLQPPDRRGHAAEAKAKHPRPVHGRDVRVDALRGSTIRSESGEQSRRCAWIRRRHPTILPGTEYTFYMNPHVAKDFTDAFILKVAGEYLPKVGRPWHEKEFTTGTDTYLAEPMVGVPTVWGYSGSGVETHHNSEDTPDRVDERSLRDISVIDAAFLYFIANAGEPEALWLGPIEREPRLRPDSEFRRPVPGSESPEPRTQGARTAARGGRGRRSHIPWTARARRSPASASRSGKPAGRG